MNTSAAEATAEPHEQCIELRGRQRLTIIRDSGRGEDVLHLEAGDGTTTLLVRVGPGGTQVELGAASLALRVQGELAIDAGRIALHAREGLSLTTGGNFVMRSGAALAIEAVEQKLVATRGDISLYANDDVKVDGERIRMNC
jgi:hypothetical protein